MKVRNVQFLSEVGTYVPTSVFTACLGGCRIFPRHAALAEDAIWLDNGPSVVSLYPKATILIYI